ncbi:MAG: hypothetical protein QJR12_04775 [Mycobacterium sp.]|uniref:hypothetical protein n=1 Tax=Mycobacterium sp. TaxID=1785 RepID=UPI0026357F68|nr:hypothetical protein [Mycobacterium sp.]MDI3313610.1 hypothetical protein [Mycobacterium sp.]
MTSVSAAFYDVAQRRREGPALVAGLRSRALRPIPEEWHRYLNQTAFDAFFITAPFAEARTEGHVGVPILSQQEVEFLLGAAEFRRGESNDREQQTWWELWSTEDGKYALLPGDNDPELTIRVCALVCTGNRVQMRSFSTGFALTKYGFRRRKPMHITTAVCVREDVDEPGAPYRGRCANHGCGAGCSADVVVVPQDGLYLLRGCACPS